MAKNTDELVPLHEPPIFSLSKMKEDDEIVCTIINSSVFTKTDKKGDSRKCYKMTVQLENGDRVVLLPSVKIVSALQFDENGKTPFIDKKIKLVKGKQIKVTGGNNLQLWEVYEVRSK